jgi:hypothetical protein
MSTELVERAELDKKELPSRSLRVTVPSKRGNSSMFFVRQTSLSIPSWLKWLDMVAVEGILDMGGTGAVAAEEVIFPVTHIKLTL